MAEVEKVAEQAGKVSAETTEAAVKEVASGAEAAVAAAQARAEEATRTAEQISQAALHTELGARIQRHDEELNTWRVSEAQRQQEIQELRSQNSQLREMMQGQQLILEKLTQPPPQPPPLEEEVVKPSDTTKTEASERKEDQTKTLPQRRRLFL